jgi:hypothetical protein
MSDYTPTTEQVRTAVQRFYVPDLGYDSLSVAEFDRWLAEHDAEVAAKAIEKAVKVAEDRAYDLWACHKEDDCSVVATGAQFVADDLRDLARIERQADEPIRPNPYRKAAEQ